MLRSKFDVTNLIKKSGKNVIAVLITDADQKKTRKAKDPYGVACSPSYLAGAGWDWMPYVPGRLAGITGNAYLVVTGDVVIGRSLGTFRVTDLAESRAFCLNRY